MESAASKKVDGTLGLNAEPQNAMNDITDDLSNEIKITVFTLKQSFDIVGPSKEDMGPTLIVK